MPQDTPSSEFVLRLPPSLESRRDQIFPVLGPEELARMRRFGDVLHFDDAAAIFETGKRAAGMFVVLAGAIHIMRREGLGNALPPVEHGIAHGQVEALRIAPERLRALMIAEAIWARS